MKTKKQPRPKIDIAEELIEKTCLVFIKDSKYEILDMMLHSLSHIHMKRFSASTLKSLVKYLEPAKDQLSNYKPFKYLVELHTKKD